MAIFCFNVESCCVKMLSIIFTGHVKTNLRTEVLSNPEFFKCLLVVKKERKKFFCGFSSLPGKVMYRTGGMDYLCDSNSHFKFPKACNSLFVQKEKCSLPLSFIPTVYFLNRLGRLQVDKKLLFLFRVTFRFPWQQGVDDICTLHGFLSGMIEMHVCVCACGGSECVGYCVFGACCRTVHVCLVLQFVLKQPD